MNANITYMVTNKNMATAIRLKKIYVRKLIVKVYTASKSSVTGRP